MHNADRENKYKIVEQNYNIWQGDKVGQVSVDRAAAETEEQGSTQRKTLGSSKQNTWILTDFCLPGNHL